MRLRWLLLALLIIPALEIGVFIWLGNLTGPLWVVLLILITGAIGVLIARKQGFRVWKRVQFAIDNGVPPTVEVMDGICIFIGAALVFAPGFLTDVTGFLFLIPFTRKPIRNWIEKWLRSKMENGTVIYRKW